MFGCARHIVTIALTLFYAAGAHASAIQLAHGGVGSSSGHAVTEGSGKRNVPLWPVWTQRRHIPLVHHISVSPGEPPSPDVPDTKHAFALLPYPPPNVPGISDYFSSGCNKAPPGS
jgi:hypothetical protein